MDLALAARKPRQLKSVLAKMVYVTQSLGCMIAFGTFSCSFVCAQDDPRSIDYFERHIRPVLVAKCVECHSTETEASGGLLLDSREGWRVGGDSGAAIEPGKAADSRLMKAIGYTDPDLQMPPDNPLPAAVVKHFERWIDAGALDPREPTAPKKVKSTGLPVERAREFWSYRPVVQPAIPTLHNTAPLGEVRNSIDAFVMKRIEEADVPVASEADRMSLLRRLCFDLHGLPPTEEMLVSFRDDEQPDAYERMVDRLMASPRYGERMARHWMDVARYAESITLRGFVLPQAWRYREYLIESLASDKPFDLFIREQIAGDLMQSDDPAVRSQQMIATTFLALGNTNLEEQDKDQLEMDYVDEQLEVIGRVFMGQTIGCARCHDHKFDPIPQRDYYAMAGILKAARAMDHENVSKWIEKPLPVDADRDEQYAKAEKQLAELKSREEALTKKSDKKASRKGSVAIGSLDGMVIDDNQAVKVGQWKDSSAIGPYVGASYIHDLHESVAKSITYEPKNLKPGMYEVRCSYSIGSNRTTNAPYRVFSADGEKLVIVNQQVTPPIEDLWFSLGTYRFEKDGQAFVLLSNENTDGIVIADAIQFLPKDETTLPPGAAKPAIARADDKAKDSAANEADSEISKEEMVKRELELKSIKSQRSKLEALLASRPRTMTIEEVLPARDLPINVRGNVHNVGAIVPRGFLTCAETQKREPFGEQTSGRLQMAEWLCSYEHPLTPRVLANRLWLWTFGTGVVRTVDNFGTTGEAPTDPELLDHLASELMRYDWSHKQLVRSLLLSAAYRRASVADERAQELDPENKLWSHAVRKRIDVESLRDSMLLLSGELTTPTGQSTLKPNVKDDYRYEHLPHYRSVYQPILRNSLPELYDAFDFPNPSISIGQRSESVVSPQALSMMNSPWILARSAQMAKRVIANDALLTAPVVSKDDWRQQVDDLFFSMLGRRPTEVERYTALSLIDELERQHEKREAIIVRVIHGIMASIDFRYLD